MDFNTEVRPILNKHCVKCHGGVKINGNLSLQFRADALKAGESKKPAIVPGQPAQSHVIERITASDPKKRMPPEGAPLEAAQVDTLKRWIAQGAPWADHWAFTTPTSPPLPAVKNAAWARNGLDRFVLARLEREGVKPSAEAPKSLLLRRASLDLTGLPPTVEEMRAFAADTSPEAYEKAVDRLLASPRFGERWAALWMDLARYADSKGYEKDALRPMWPYRDWLIRAFNADMPYDRFTIEQLAGDLLPGAGEDEKIATAFHRMTMTNDEGGTDDEEFRTAAVLDRVNTTWQVWMGTTFNCVQCHGHPYDPFKHDEYFRFLAFFNTSQDADRGDDAPTMLVTGASAREQAAELDREIAAIRQQLAAVKPATEPAVWTALPAGEAKAAAGSVVTIDQGAVRVDGKNLDQETVIVDAPVPLGKLAALRLETLPDPKLKNGGAGRGTDGNFVLSGFQASLLLPAGAPAMPARFVRIELPGQDRVLHVAEIEAFDATGSNVARAGQAKLSSTYADAVAGRAIDGNTDGDYEQNSVAHAADGDDDPWLEVDLGTARDIRRVVVWNRTDHMLQARLNGARVELLDADRRPFWRRVLYFAPNREEVLAVDPRERLLNLAAAEATYEQPNYPVAAALRNPDPLGRGWAIAPHYAKSHQAVFRLAEPVEVPAGAQVRLLLDHHHTASGYRGAALARYRCSVTDDAKATLAGNGSKQKQESEQKIAALQKQREKLGGQRLPVMQELPADQARKTHVFVRGNWMTKGLEVTAGVPASLPPLPANAPSNRLGMAQWLVSPEHPLTARVAVNRFWEQVFGIGLVETLEDLGTQGEAPSHRELLDWLAVRYRTDLKWSTKALLREIVTSATYRQSSVCPPEMAERDPRNRLLARGPRIRLTAEQLRDHALAVAGLLSPKLYGPGVMPPQPEGIWKNPYSGEKWTTAEGEDRYRRGLYTFWRRTTPYPSMIAFDATSREVCSIRRIRTNTPLQPLVTLNDPVYVEAAQALAKRMAKDAAGAEERIALGFLAATGEEPKPKERDALLGLYRDALKHFEKLPEDARKVAANPEEAAWTTVAAALLNLDKTQTKS